MAQIRYRANLSSDLPVLVSTFAGKTVIDPGPDQSYISSPFGDNAANPPKGIPECYYMHNIVPSKYGYKSVAYEELISTIGSEHTFTHVFPVIDFSNAIGLLGITAEGETFLLTKASPTWTDITPVGQPVGGDVTVANVTGNTIICYAEFEIYTIDLSTKALSVASISWDSPLTNADILGIADSNNYLLAHDGSTLYWSSALDVFDMQASQITGAGNGVPTGTKGNIVVLAPVGTGFAVYCQGNIIVAVFSGNVQYPWLFKEAANGAGISGVDAVSQFGDDNSNYAWTVSGLLKVTLGGCTPIFPEVTDFLGGRIFEDYNYATNIISQQYIDNNLKVRPYYLSSRFLLLSYGISSFTHILIYDSALKRWGKLKIAHATIIDIPFEFSTGSGVPYSSLSGFSYKDLRGTPINSLTDPTINIPPTKHAITVVGLNGSLQRLISDYSDDTAKGVLVLGKYQLQRNNWLSINEVNIETIDSDNSNIELLIGTSYDGKNIELLTEPYEEISENLRRYLTIVEGQNHSIIVKGAFHLVSLELLFSPEGNS